MTKPVQEPSTQRQIANLTWGENQLFRRPAPISRLVYGEAYKDTDQTVTTNAMVRLSNWDAWNVPYPTVINQGVRALEVLVDGYYVVSGLVVFQEGTFAPGDTWFFSMAFQGTGGGGDYFVDTVRSDVQIVDANYTSQSLDSWKTSLWLIPANTEIEVWVNQNSSGGNEDVAASFLRIAFLSTADTSFDPPP